LYVFIYVLKNILMLRYFVNLTPVVSALVKQKCHFSSMLRALSQRPSPLFRQNISGAGAVGVWPDKYWPNFACCLCVQESDVISIW
jgi:hypothetical protein